MWARPRLSQDCLVLHISCFLLQRSPHVITLNWGGVTLDPIICSSSYCSDLNFISFLCYFLFVCFVLILRESVICNLTLLEHYAELTGTHLPLHSSPYPVFFCFLLLSNGPMENGWPQSGLLGLLGPGSAPNDPWRLPSLPPGPQVDVRGTGAEP